MKKTIDKNHKIDEVRYEEDEWDVIDLDSDEEAYEDGVKYADEEAYEDETEYADGEVYEDEAEYADGEVYEDEAEYADDEVYEDDVEYADDEEYYEADEYDESEEAFGKLHPVKNKKTSRRNGNNKAGISAAVLWKKFLRMNPVDRVLMSLGALVLVFAIVTCSIFGVTKLTEGQVASFKNMGAELQNIGIIGESGMMAITDATMARIDELNGASDEDEEEEEEEGAVVNVNMTFTSIQKDLKIKFINQKTGKLIAGVPFTVMLESPSGKNLTWADDDKDGIIYQKNIEYGDYKVTLQALADEVFAKYILDTTTQTATVRKEIAYSKVDVSDEVKSESEINASEEDTEEENAVESALTDTVGWVATSTTSLGENYVAVDKNKIVKPTTTARLDVSGFVAVGAVVDSPTTPTDPPTPTPTEPTGPTEPTEVTFSVTPKTATLEIAGTTTIVPSVTGVTTPAVSFSSSDTAVATVDASGVVTAHKGGTTVITATLTYDVNGAHTTKTDTCTITVNAAAVTVTMDKTTANVAIKGTITLKATVSDASAVTWSSADDKIATVDSKGVVTGIKAGNVVITAKSGEATATCTVTVTAERTVTLDATTATVYVGATKTLKATVTGYTDLSKGALTWTSSDKSIATVDDKGVVTGIKAGTVTITAISTEDKVEVKAQCSVMVKAAAALVTTDGKPVFVKNAKGEYVAATAADYENASAVFYIKEITYKYTGWQTLNGKTYYYDANGNVVKGEQVIQGAKYTFGNDGALVSSAGMLGIDVSKWNGTIDWKAVKNSGVSYVIIRCGYRGSSTGVLVQDPKFTTNISGALAAGLKVGVYFFSQAIDEVEAVQEASMVIGLISKYKISYPVFLDVEGSGGRGDSVSKDMRTKVCKAFCATIQNAGYKAGVYANKSWLTNKIDTSQLSNYVIWLAQYAAAPTYSGRYNIWQYKSTGSINGISGYVDLNLSYLGY